MVQKKKKDFLHIAISWGASVVILGALFKILHIGGVYGNYMIGLGLGVEAFLFFLTGLFPPQKELPWERVYPELSDNYTDVTPPHTIRASTSSALEKVLEEAKVSPEVIESLGSALKNFSEKVIAISNVADVSMATADFTQKVKHASASYAQLTQAFENVSMGLNELKDAYEDTKAYHEQVNNLAKNLSALNAVYELELQDSSVHLKAMNQFYQNIALTMQNFNESVNESSTFKEQVGRLAKNVSSLNEMYSNMLSAMNQPHA